MRFKAYAAVFLKIPFFLGCDPVCTGEYLPTFLVIVMRSVPLSGISSIPGCLTMEVNALLSY